MKSITIYSDDDTGEKVGKYFGIPTKKVISEMAKKCTKNIKPNYAFRDGDGYLYPDEDYSYCPYCENLEECGGSDGRN